MPRHPPTAMRCAHCGHPLIDHGDRAVGACSYLDTWPEILRKMRVDAAPISCPCKGWAVTPTLRD